MRFQFVDRIEEARKYAYARGVKTVSFEEGFLPSLNREPGCIPRMLFVECAAQLVSWLVLYSSDFSKIPVIAKIDQAVIEHTVPCGSAVTMEVEITSWNDDGAMVNCRGMAGGKPIAQGLRCLCTFLPSETLVDPDEMRVRFGEIAKGANLA